MHAAIPLPFFWAMLAFAPETPDSLPEFVTWKFVTAVLGFIVAVWKVSSYHTYMVHRLKRLEKANGILIDLALNGADTATQQQLRAARPSDTAD